MRFVSEEEVSLDPQRAGADPALTGLDAAPVIVGDVLDERVAYERRSSRCAHG